MAYYRDLLRDNPTMQIEFLRGIVELYEKPDKKDTLIPGINKSMAKAYLNYGLISITDAGFDIQQCEEFISGAVGGGGWAELTPPSVLTPVDQKVVDGIKEVSRVLDETVQAVQQLSVGMGYFYKAEFISARLGVLIEEALVPWYHNT